MKNVLTALLLLLCAIAFSQKANQIKIYYGFVKGDYEVSNDLNGSGSINEFKAPEIGIRYNRQISEILRIETGIHHFSSDITITGAPIPHTQAFEDHLELMSVPITLLAEFWKYFYANGGIIVDFQTKETTYVSSQSGIGLTFGLGAQYEYKDFLIYINPEIRRHRLIGFDDENNAEYLINSTIQIGVGYNF